MSCRDRSASQQAARYTLAPLPVLCYACVGAEDIYDVNSGISDGFPDFFVSYLFENAVAEQCTVFGGLVGVSQAQIPAGFTPSIATHLDVMFNSTVISPAGIMLAKASK